MIYGGRYELGVVTKRVGEVGLGDTFWEIAHYDIPSACLSVTDNSLPH